MISEASILTAEAASLQSLAAWFRSKPGEFSRNVGANLAVMAADFHAQAMRPSVKTNHQSEA